MLSEIFIAPRQPVSRLKSGFLPANSSFSLSLSVFLPWKDWYTHPTQRTTGTHAISCRGEFPSSKNHWIVIEVMRYVQCRGSSGDRAGLFPESYRSVEVKREHPITIPEPSQTSFLIERCSFWPLIARFSRNRQCGFVCTCHARENMHHVLPSRQVDCSCSCI